MKQSQPDAQTLCIACGLCCTGHLFSWVELEDEEIKKTRILKTTLYKEGSSKYGLNQPCPYWERSCTIYDHPDKPNRCSEFSCNLLNDLVAGKTTLDHALAKIQQTQTLIARLESQLPASTETCFRNRLFGFIMALEKSGDLEGENTIFRLESGSLLVLYEKYFGLTKLFEHPGMTASTDTKEPDAKRKE